MTGVLQSGEGGESRCMAVSYCCRAIFARSMLSPSALLTVMASASSRTPFLIPWSSSPAPAIMSTRKKSTMEATATSELPHAHRLHQDDVVARGFADHHGLPGLAGHPAEGPAGRGGPDESPFADGEFLHPGLVGQDAPALVRAARVDGQHGHPEPLLREHHAEALDEGAVRQRRARP